MASNGPIEVLKELKVHFDRVRESSELLRRSMSRKKKGNVLGDLDKEIKTIDTKIRSLTKEITEFSMATVKGNKKAAKSVKDVTTEYEKQSRVVNNSKKKPNVVRSSMLGTAKEFAKMQAMWYPIKAFTFKALAIPGDILKDTGEYGDLLAQVSSVSGSTASSLSKLDKELRDVGTSTKFSMMEVAKAAKILAQAGFRGDEVIEAIRPVSLLATATSASVEESVSLVSTVVRAYKLSVTEISEISDNLANAVVNSRLTLGDLNLAFGYVASAAHQSGVSLNETIGLLGVLANAGMKATTSATGLRMMLLKLTSPTRKAKKVLASVGLSKRDLNASTKGVKQVIAELGKLSRANLVDIFGARSANVVLALTSAGTKSIELMQEAIEASGTASRMAEEQLLSLKLSWKQLQDTLVETNVSMGNTFAKDLAIDVRVATSVLKSFNSSLPKTIKLMTILESVVSGFFAYIGVRSTLFSIKKLTGAFNVLQKVFTSIARGSGPRLLVILRSITGLTPAMLPLATTLGVVVTAIGAVGYSVWNSAKNFEKFKTSLTELSVSFGKASADTLKFKSSLAALEHYNVPKAVKRVVLGNAEKDYKELLTQRTEDIKKSLQGDNQALSIVGKIHQQGIDSIAEAFKTEDYTAISNAASESLKRLTDFHKKYLKKQETIIKQSPVINWKGVALATLKKSLGKFGSIITEGAIESISPSKGSRLAVVKKAGESYIKSTKEISKLFSEITVETSNLNNDIKSYTNKGFVTSLDGIGEFSTILKDYKSKLKVLTDNIKTAGTATNPQIAALRSFRETVKRGENVKKSFVLDMRDPEVVDLFSSVMSKYTKEYTTEVDNIHNLVKTSGKAYEDATKEIKTLHDNTILQVVDAMKAILHEEDLDGKLDGAALINIFLTKFGEKFEIKKDKLKIVALVAEANRLKIEKAIADNMFASAQTDAEKEKFRKAAKHWADKLNDNAIEQLQIKNPSLVNSTKRLQASKDRKDNFNEEERIAAEKLRNLKEEVSYFSEFFEYLKDTLDSAVTDGLDLEATKIREQLFTVLDQLVSAKQRLLDADTKIDPKLKKLREEELAQFKKMNKDLLKEHNRFYTQLKQDSKDILQTGIGNELDALIEGTKSVSEAFKDMAKSILKSFAKLAAAKLLKNGLDDLFETDFMSGIFGGGQKRSRLDDKNALGTTIAKTIISAIANWGFGAATTSATSGSTFNLSEMGTDPTTGVFDSLKTNGRFFGEFSSSSASTVPSTVNTSNVRFGASPSFQVTNNSSSQVQVVDYTMEKDRLTGIILEDLNSNGVISQSIGRN